MGATSRVRSLTGALSALAVFGAATALLYAELWSRGAHRNVAMAEIPKGEHSQGIEITSLADATFEAWLVSRNARTLTTAPHRLFDAEHCAPAGNTLAYGIPMITMGLLAAPAWYATGDPVLTYNLTIAALTLLAALAMYLLVTSWTGVPAAGIAAGLLFAFHPSRVADIGHPSVWDATWALPGLWFAERLFARGRWGDALGLGLAIALQTAASFYSLLAAALVALPFLAWLLLRSGLRQLPLGPLAFAVAIAAAAAAAVLLPYLGVETDAGAMHREAQVFSPLFVYLPGGPHFPGAALLLLVAAALLAPRAALRIEGDPRWALLAGAACAGLVAAGPLLAHPLPPSLAAWVPDFHALGASLLPGLDAVRGIDRLSQGVHLALALLAGLGAGRLLGATRFAPIAAVALVLVAGLDVLRAPSLGLPRTYAWHYEAVEPDPEAIAFFEELERRGNRGPILELPVRLDRGYIPVDTRRILLSTFHRRRTSACFGSYTPPGRDALLALSQALPEPAAIRALADLGFTTLVLEPKGSRDTLPLAQVMRLERAAARGEGLTRVHLTPERGAYALHPEQLPQEDPSPGDGESDAAAASPGAAGPDTREPPRGS